MGHINHVPNHRKLWRMREYHAKNASPYEFPGAFDVGSSYGIRVLIANGLVAFFKWVRNDIQHDT